jgi:methanogenic corrinoid protein MtbC1
MDHTPKLRIGELSHRVGVRPELLRAWERRYGVLRPARSERGFRLYSAADERRVRLMQEKLSAWLSAAEAAREVTRVDDTGDSFPSPFELSLDLGTALEAFDEEEAHTVLDRLLGNHGLETTIRDALMPYLHELGERWAREEVSVAQEHFASRLLEARMLALARGWNKGPGPRAVLACPSGEQHTLPLVCFGLALRNRGWRNIYLGADSPLPTLHMAADTVSADVIVLSAASEDRYEPIIKDLAALARRRRLLIAGGGATRELAAELGAEYLTDDPATAAEGFARRHLSQSSK